MKFINFFLGLREIFSLLDPDQDLGTPLNPDPDAEHCRQHREVLFLLRVWRAAGRLARPLSWAGSVRTSEGVESC